MPTQIDEVAKVYARSLFELARELGGNAGIASMGEELRGVCEAAKADARTQEFFHSPIVDPKRRADSLKRILAGRASDTLVNFILVLNAKGRLGQLFDVAEARRSRPGRRVPSRGCRRRRRTRTPRRRPRGSQLRRGQEYPEPSSATRCAR